MAHHSMHLLVLNRRVCKSAGCGHSEQFLVLEEFLEEEILANCEANANEHGEKAKKLHPLVRGFPCLVPNFVDLLHVNHFLPHLLDEILVLLQLHRDVVDVLLLRQHFPVLRQSAHPPVHQELDVRGRGLVFGAEADLVVALGLAVVGAYVDLPRGLVLELLQGLGSADRGGDDDVDWNLFRV